jgi:glycosyltransferase involved in cell wall biosynthesis
MGYGNCVVVSDTAFHTETIGDAGVAFALDAGDEDLRQKLQWLLDDPAVVESYRQRAVDHVSSHYQWDQVVDAHEALYAKLLGQRPEAAPKQSRELVLPGNKEKA